MYAGCPLGTMSHLILTAIPLFSDYYPHFTYEGVEIQRSSFSLRALLNAY